MINWSALSSLQNRPSIGIIVIGLGQDVLTAALYHEDIISDLSPVFESITELCTSSGHSILIKVVPIAKMMSPVKWGCCQTLLPLLVYTLD